MKKTLMTCLVVIALFAVAGTASAITCTVDQRPAATLLVPYFEVAYNADGTLVTGAGARDTLVTIVNASAAPMIAHVTVFNERSVLVLDFNIALTGFDVQAMSIGQVLRGNLPRTGYIDGGGTLRDACQRNPLAPVYPDPNGFIRVRPGSPALPEDNTLATTLYPIPAYGPTDPFLFQVLDSLDGSPGSLGCNVGPDGVISGLIRGYITIDHANYCNLSNPSDPFYYSRDAIGNENNLWGEVIFVSGAGVGTFGGSTVNIEADASLDGAGTSDTTPRRTFYRRYWSATGATADNACTNCGSGNDQTDLNLSSPWNFGVGDRREPLGLKYAARWFEGAGVTSALRVWRGSTGSLANLTGSPSGACNASEPTVTLTFYDEDENTVTAGVCPSPCTQPSFNFPRETQRTAVAGFSRPAGAVAGWVNMVFFNPTAPLGGVLDQAWVEYEFQGAGAFLSMSAPATQLDPTTCSPLGVPPGAITPTAPAIPVIVGTGS